MAVTTVRGAGEQSKKQPKARADQPVAPGEEEIRILAYQVYERRCADGVDGDALSDWVEAERRLHLD